MCRICSYLDYIISYVLHAQLLPAKSLQVSACSRCPDVIFYLY